jgi:large subunit ribosomal protein L1
MPSGKKFAAAKQAVPDRPHTIEEAVPLMQKVKFAKFDETVELAMRLGVDPKHADQMVRGTVVLPHGLGKSKKVLAIAGPDKQKEAEAAGADHVGGEEMVDSVVKAKPSAAKGKYLKSVTLSSTMGPGITIDTTHVSETVKH